MPIQVANGIPHLVNQDQLWKPPPHPRLSEGQSNDIKNAYPLPLIPDIFDQVSKAKAKYSSRWTFNGDMSRVGVSLGLPSPT